MRRILLGLCFYPFWTMHPDKRFLCRKKLCKNIREYWLHRRESRKHGSWLKEKWAKDVFNKLKERTEVYTNLTDAQLAWLLSRLAMYWKSFCNGGICERQKRSIMQVVKSSLSHCPLHWNPWHGCYHGRPKLADVVLMTMKWECDFHNALGCKRPWRVYTHPNRPEYRKSEPGNPGIAPWCSFSFIGWRMKRNSWNLLPGVLIRIWQEFIIENVPIDLNHGHQQTLWIDFFEVIHEDASISLSLYTIFLYNYLKTNYPDKWKSTPELLRNGRIISYERCTS